MSKLLDEANAYIARADIGHRDPSKLNEAHRLIVKLTDALEAAEQSVIEAAALKDTVCDWKQQAKHAIKEKCRLDERLAALRALLPALNALDEAGKKATKGEWGRKGDIVRTNIGREFKGEGFDMSTSHTPIADFSDWLNPPNKFTNYESNGDFIVLSANEARPTIADLVRILEGGE